MARARKATPGRTRIKDVARRARVSVGTVSHVLSGRVQVSDTLRARVQKAVAAMGYVPNFHAQRLRHGMSRVIGICMPHTSTAYLNLASEAFEEVASRNGYSVMHVFSRHEPAIELDRIKELIHYRADGLVLFPSFTPGEALELAARKEVPLVIVDRPTPDRRFDQVILDNRGAMREVVRRLAALGHRRILFVCQSTSRLVTQHRLGGLADACKRHGVGSETIEFQHDAAFLRDELARALARKRAPTALVLSNSHQASLALRLLAELRVDCPGELSVVAFDDPEWSTLVRPALSVVRQPAVAMVEAAWDLLIQRINRVAAPIRTVALEATIEFRGSVAGVAKAADSRVVQIGRPSSL
ncbi:MAG: LacI family DNA-binding transcriptional regulator [Burkholderiales bacterium]|nr:LacI family DNA-binding transcriptional regulator [Burkholderiales bacterium]